MTIHSIRLDNHDDFRASIEAVPVAGLTFGDYVGDWLSSDAWDTISEGEYLTPTLAECLDYIAEDVLTGFIDCSPVPKEAMAHALRNPGIEFNPLNA